MAYDEISWLGSLGISDCFIKLFDRKYTEVWDILINDQFGYDPLGGDLLLRAVKYARRHLLAPEDDGEVVARLRRLEKFYMCYKMELFNEAECVYERSRGICRL